MILPEQFLTPNSHWEDWTLPNWFHARTPSPSIVQSRVSEESSGEATSTASTSELNAIQALDIETTVNDRAQVRTATGSPAKLSGTYTCSVDKDQGGIGNSIETSKIVTCGKGRVSFHRRIIHIGAAGLGFTLLRSWQTLDLQLGNCRKSAAWSASTVCRPL